MPIYLFSKVAIIFFLFGNLIIHQVPIIGLIYQPTSEKLYFTNHKQEFCLEKNGNIVEILKREDENFIAVVSSRNFNYKTEKYIQDKGFSEVISIPSSIKLCMIAEGSVDVYPKFGSTMEWDTAAGQALIRAAGGTVIDNNTGKTLLYNTKNNFKNPDFIAFNQKYRYLDN
jgi:3'(2'), 5'-bisphosphate nucleotidase